MTATRMCPFVLCAALVSTAAIVPAAPAAAQTCDGDCNGDRSVAIGELILGVRIAFGDAPIDDRQAIDGDGNGAVRVNEIVAAVPVDIESDVDALADGCCRDALRAVAANR